MVSSFLNGNNHSVSLGRRKSDRHTPTSNRLLYHASYHICVTSPRRQPWHLLGACCIATVCITAPIGCKNPHARSGAQQSSRAEILESQDKKREEAAFA